MRKYLRLAPFAILGLLAVTLIVGRLLPNSRPPPPANSTEMAARAAPLGWRAYPLSSLTCYLSDHPLADEDLEALEHDTAHAPEWKGVVWCERGKPSGEGTQAGGWVLYGDPAMVRKLRELLTP